MHDMSLHQYLALRVRLGGHPRTRNSYFVNIQTDGAINADLWQHRLYTRRDDGDWEDVFVRTNENRNICMISVSTSFLASSLRLCPD
jgi:hypothetical protein